MSLKALRKLAKEARDLRKQTKEVLQKPNQTPQGTGQQEFKQTRKAYKLFVQRDDGGLYPLFVDADKRIPEKVFTEANFPKESFEAPNGRLYVPSKGAKRTKGEKKKGTGVPIIVPDEKTKKMLQDAGYSVSKPKEGAEHGTVLAVAARPGYHASQKPVATHIGPQDLKVTSKEADKLLKAGIAPEAIRKRKGQLYVKRRAEDQVFAEVDMADDVDYQSILAKEGKTDINDKVPLGGSYSYVDGQADSDNWVVGGNMRVNRVLSKDEVKTIQQQEGVKDLPYKDEVENILGRKFAEGGLVEGDDMQQGVDDYVVAKTESEGMEMNIGGAPKKNLEAQQLEMFGDIGMAKSPAKKDPISGNEIPKASTAEEVRDDIPAKLSEGEFVLPADVVRYHGLEKLMSLRQQAKQGINTMDKMGQLGNSEEATMPDDLPFDVNDIEMSEGGFMNVAGQSMPSPRIAGEQIEMQTGGLAGTGTYQVPTNIATTPSYFQNYAQTTAPFKPFVPQNQTAIPPVAPVTPPKTTGPSFQTLIPSQGQRPVTKEYRNAAGQKLFIPFINDKPIYPIPEGYTEYVEEKAEVEKPVVESATVRKPIDDGGDSNVLSDTSQVRGTDNSLIDTRFGGQSTEKIKDSFSKMSESQRGLAVINAIDSAKGSNAFARNLASGMLGVAGGPLGMVAGAYDAGSRMMGGEGLGLGQPQTDAFNNIISTFEQQYEGMSGEERDQDQYPKLDSLSQAVYGKNYEDATTYLGTAPTFKKGFKPGEIDPRTGGTYDIYGQSQGDDGGVSYSSFSAAGDGFAAMAASGFMGGVKDAQRVATKDSASPKDKARAQAYLDYLNKETKKEKTSGLIEDKLQRDADEREKKAADKAKRDREAKERREKLLQEQQVKKDIASGKADTSIPTGPDDYGVTDDIYSGSGGSRPGQYDFSATTPQVDYSSYYDDNNDSDDSPGGGSASGGDSSDMGFSTASGGFIKKKNLPKANKKKRGGLASR